MLVSSRVKFVNEECRLVQSLKSISSVEVKILATKLLGNTVFHFIELVGEKSELLKTLKSLKKSRELRVIGYKRAGKSLIAIVSTEACSTCRVFYEDSKLFTLTLGFSNGIFYALIVASLKNSEDLIKKFRENIRLVDLEVSEINSRTFLTLRQERVLRRAVEAGYYNIPRKVGLEELAKKLDLSKSGVADALRRAEAKAVKLILELEDSVSWIKNV